LRARPDLKDNFTPYLGAIVASLFFGLNPLRVESVVWISGRKDLLCAFFFIPGLFAYIKFTSAKSESKRRSWYWTCLSCHLFALLSKGMAMTLPVVLILMDIYPMNRLNNWKDIPRLLYEKIPFFLLSIADAAIVLFGVKQHGSIVSTDIFSLKTKLLNSVQALIIYIQKTLLPTGLSPYYPFKEQLLIMDSNFVLSLLLLTGASVFVYFKLLSGQRFWMVAFLYFLVTVAPVIGLVQIGSAAIADRYTYLPTLSCIFLLAGAITIGVDKKSLRMIYLARIATATVLVCLYFLSIKQTKIWSNSISLWSQVTSVYPGRSHVAHANLGQGFKAYGNYDRALMEYKTADRITPNKATLLNNIGVLYMQKNRMDQAIEYYKRTLAVDPGYTHARNNLGYAYYRNGWLVKAERELNLAKQLQPDMNLIYINLGMVYLKQGELIKAEKKFKQAIEIQPSFFEAYNHLG